MALTTENETLRSIGQWDLIERLATSGMGTVYKARHRVSGEVAAVKVLPPFQAGKEQAYQRFARECRILSALNDPHIVRALDFGIEGCDPYLVMEFVEGERLSERVTRVGPLPEAEAIRLITQVAGALDRMHGRKLVHRNVQPDSILITPDGQAKLTDLCLIKEVESHDALTRDGTFLGTPHFMAPEQFRNAAKATRRSDVYALAATLYLAVTGEPPFGGCHVIETCARKLRNEVVAPRAHMPGLSEGTERAILRALNAEPMNRPDTCEEFIASLKSDSAGHGLAATTDGSIDPTATESPCLSDAALAADTADVARSAPAVILAHTQTGRIDAADDSDGSGWGWLWFVAVTLITAFLSGLFFLRA